MSYFHNEPLLTEYNLGDLKLRNRVIMASLTRGRSGNSDLAPTHLHAIYYCQRASAGLILTESTWVSPRAIGFINLPGIYSQAQVEGWTLVTKAVHARNGLIFLQIVHSGAVSHPDFFNGELPWGPSAINPMEKTFTPNGLKDTLTPNPFTIEEIHKTIGEFKQAAQNAKTAGFDGIEIHGHLFTLIPQFLSSSTNQRNDEYGGSIQNRARLLFEIIDAVKEVYPGNRIGIKFSPVAFNTGMIKPDQLTIPTYEYILDKLNDYHLGYVQLVGPATDLKGTAVEALAHDYFRYFGQIYRGTMIANLGFNQETGNAIIADGHADLVSFGTPFIANPDLVERFDQRLALAQPDRETFYTGGEKGYTDYPRATK